jgi:hypothetical protein
MLEVMGEAGVEVQRWKEEYLFLLRSLPNAHLPVNKQEVRVEVSG